MPSRVGVAKYDGATRRPADIGVRCIVKHFLNFFRGDPMQAAVLDVAIWIVIKIPND
jgi:hypothetical protein